MTKRLVTTSIEEKIYDEFCQSIGRKKINQVLQEYMASVVDERKKAKARK
jgi:hypothetical protein